MAIPKTLTVKQAMAKTGFPRSAVYRLVHSGAWASIKFTDGRTSTIRIIEPSVEAWFEAQLKGQRVATPRALDADHSLPRVENPMFS